MNEIHLVLVTGVRCHCRARASRWMRCATCRAVVARCPDHDRELAREREEHCR